MKMAFVKRDDSKNAIGVRFVFSKTATVKDIIGVRKWYAKRGFTETRTTKNMTEKQVLAACREKRQ